MPATPAGAVVEKGTFFAWGTVVSRSYGPEDDFLGGTIGGRGIGTPNRIVITIAGGSDNIVRMRDQGLRLGADTTGADYRTAITYDRVTEPVQTTPGSMLQMAGRVVLDVAGGRRFVADIVRGHEFAVSEHQQNTVEIRKTSRGTDEFGDDMETHRGKVISGPLRGWSVTAEVSCVYDFISWQAADLAGNSLTGTYSEFWHDGFFGPELEEIASRLTGGTGVYSGATGGSRWSGGCNTTRVGRVEIEPVETFTAGLEIDVRAAG